MRSSSNFWGIKNYKIPTNHFQNRNIMAYKKSIKSNKKYVYSSRKRNVSAINKSDLLLEKPQKEHSFVKCVCVYIYVLPNPVLGGRDKEKNWSLLGTQSSKEGRRTLTH